MTRKKENLKQWIQGLNTVISKQRMLQFVEATQYDHLTGFISCLFLHGLISDEEHNQYFNIIKK